MYSLPLPNQYKATVTGAITGGVSDTFSRLGGFAHLLILENHLAMMQGLPPKQNLELLEDFIAENNLSTFLQRWMGRAENQIIFKKIL